MRVRLDASIDAAGDLVLEGYDIGPLVQETWGDADYEYWLTVRAHHLPLVAEELLAERCPAPADRRAWLAGHGHDPGDPPPARAVLELLRELFAAERFTSDAEFRAWLDERRIASEFSSYA